MAMHSNTSHVHNFNNASTKNRAWQYSDPPLQGITASMIMKETNKKTKQKTTKQTQKQATNVFSSNYYTQKMKMFKMYYMIVTLGVSIIYPYNVYVMLFL